MDLGSNLLYNKTKEYTFIGKGAYLTLTKSVRLERISIVDERTQITST